MKAVYDYFIQRPLIVNAFTVMIIVCGFWSLLELNREMFPKVDFDVIIVTTVYPGSSAEDVEKLVTVTIERKIKGINGIKKVNAMSLEGRSIMYITVEPEKKPQEVQDDLINEINTIDDFPDDVEPPIVKILHNEGRPILDIALAGEDYNTLRKAARYLRDQLEILGPVWQVEFGGYREDEIRVEVDPDKLEHFKLTMGEIAQSIKNRNLNLTAGKIEASSGDIIVRTISEFESIEDIHNVVIRSNDSGRSVRVGDVAVVKRIPEDSEVLQRSQGEQAIFLKIRTRTGTDVIDASNLIKEKTIKHMSGYSNIKVRFADDLSYYVKRRLNVLRSSAGIGMILVVICLLCFLNWRISLVTSMGAPLAFFISFIIMDFSGISFNLISMFGLIVVLGMLVDDAIIVAEYYYQRLERGVPRQQAALEAATRTFRPVAATILTTMIAFGAMFFMGGIMGKFTRHIPLMVIICLSASLLECFLILPSHLCEFVKMEKNKKPKTWFVAMQNHYSLWLKRLLMHSGKVLLGFCMLFLFSLGLMKLIPFELFPGDDIRKVFFQIKGVVGTPREKTDDEIKKLETLAMSSLGDDELKQIKARVGELTGQHSNKTGGHYGSLIVYLTPSNERKRSTDKIIEKMAASAKELLDPSFILTVSKSADGPPRGKSIEIEIQGEDLDDLKKASSKVERRLAREEGVITTEIDFEPGKKQLVVKVDEGESKRLGLNTTQVAMELRRALAGDSLTEIREFDEDIDVKIMFDEEHRKNLDALSSLHIKNTQGRRIPLGRVIRLEEQSGSFVIRRLNRKRIFSVSAELDKKKTTSLQIIKSIRKDVQNIVSSYPQLSFQFGGENEDTEDSMRGFKRSAIIAFFLIFLVLLVMFGSIGQPLVIMSAIPLGLIGVVLTFFILGKSFGFMALMGIIALVGVVVNDSIVLINFINIKRKVEKDIFTAVLEAARDRFRPVILTTFTTVAGLLPMAHLPGGDPFIKPMAISFAWGLLFSTMVTLIFIPCNYIIYVRISGFLKRCLRFEKKSL